MKYFRNDVSKSLLRGCKGLFFIFYIVKIRFFLFLIVFSHQAMSQSPIDSAIMRLDTFVGNRPAEVIYLQTSKGIYETGEDLWCKAYVLDAQSHFLSSRSKTLYLQMFGENDETAVWQEKYPVEYGIVAGHVYVPEDLPEGNYFLEACTRHSLIFRWTSKVFYMKMMRHYSNLRAFMQVWDQCYSPR